MALVVVADDAPSIRLTLQFVLQQGGHEVLLAGDGEEALELVQQEKPDVAVLDIRMPALDGVDVCRQIKSDPALQETFVIILTSSAEMDDESGAHEAGADLYITKPVDAAALLAAVSTRGQTR